MGVFNFLTGGRARGGSFDRPSAPGSKGGAIAHDRALAPTTPNAITPGNPGNFSTIRSVPVLQQPRYFSREEANALKQLATQKRQQLTSTKSAYKSLKQAVKADATVHAEHREYETVEGRAELKKKRADGRHLKAMHALRPGYAGIVDSVAVASDRAALQIEADRQNRIARHDQFKARLAGVR